MSTQDEVLNLFLTREQREAQHLCIRCARPAKHYEDSGQWCQHCEACCRALSNGSMRSQKRRKSDSEKIRHRPLGKIPTLLFMKKQIEGRIRVIKHQPLWEVSERALAKIEAHEEAIDMILEQTGLFNEPEEDSEP